MAKALQQNQTKQIAPINNEDDDFLNQYAGAGISNSALDNIVPQIRVLQPLSPEIVEGLLPEAKPGDFLMGDTLARELWFQPCYWDQRWFEFQPLARGGGFVAAHPWMGEANGRPIPPRGAQMINEYQYKMNDNELIHYRQWSGIVWKDRMPFERSINFKSTGHTVAKNWMNVAREANRMADGRQRALFGHVYLLTTDRHSNSKGTWFQIKVGPPIVIPASENEINRLRLSEASVKKVQDIVGEDTRIAIKAGAALHDAFAGGERIAEVDAPTPTGGQSDAF